MNGWSRNVAYLPQLVGVLTAILCGTVALALFPYTTWFDLAPVRGDVAGMPNPAQPDKTGTATAEPVVPAAQPQRMRQKCPGCGMVDSVRDVTSEGDAQPSFEITVRLRDGSTRVTRATDPAQWRSGERIILIE